MELDLAAIRARNELRKAEIEVLIQPEREMIEVAKDIDTLLALLDTTTITTERDFMTGYKITHIRRRLWLRAEEVTDRELTLSLVIPETIQGEAREEIATWAAESVARQIREVK